MNIILCTDLLFSTKITGTAKALSQPFIVVRSLEKLQAALTKSPAATFIVDLGTTLIDPIAAITAAKAQSATVKIVAFVSHVDVERATAARTAGADRVMARSGFVNELPTIVSAGSAAPGDAQPTN